VAAQPSTEEVLADAQRLLGVLTEAAARLATFTDLLRTALAVLEQLDTERAHDDQP